MNEGRNIESAWPYHLYLKDKGEHAQIDSARKFGDKLKECEGCHGFFPVEQIEAVEFLNDRCGGYGEHVQTSFGEYSLCKKCLEKGERPDSDDHC